MEHQNERMKTPAIVSQQEWEAARQELLVKEKELTRVRDAMAAARRRMPWVAVEKEYQFDGPDGKASLLNLFEGRRQLILYRAFFEAGSCLPRLLPRGRPNCSSLASQRAGHHLGLCFSRPPGRHPAVESKDGLGYAVVHNH
jgi:predicted dithiol-disulfide oxidoreductase (DUF899 family)